MAVRVVLAAIGVVVLLAACGGARSVAPPDFRSAAGWHVGSLPAHGCIGVTKVRCAQAFGWASTVPYLDCEDCVPPHRTLAALPPGGIVIQLTNVREHPARTSAGGWPVRIEAADVVAGFEGLPSGRYSVFQLAVRTGGTERFLYVWFGRNHPTLHQLARANAELRTGS